MSVGSHATGKDGGALKLGRFELQRRLGEGSMGAVYLAFDRVRGDRVALKTLRRVDGAGIYRFKREFRGLADVSHPNLVALHELFSEGSDWFFTMEYVEGQDFRTYLGGEAAARAPDKPGRHTRQLRAVPSRRAPGMEVLFPTPLGNSDRARDVLRQVTSAVMALHAAGKLHRDLKPDNVMVTGEGRAVVLDFGIGAELNQDSHGTLEGGVMGTPAYMSPEQAKGGEVTEATDWYAFGVMLYEALTGQVPFDGPYLEVLDQKQRVDPPRPSELVSGVPDDLDAICVRLLARDPAERPNGQEILKALGSAGTKGAGLPANDSRPPFIGRSQEIAELERAFVGTESGAPAVVFVHGMTGMGKTALVETFLAGLDKHDAIALSGRCYEHEAVPFKALDSVVDALSRHLSRLNETEAAEVLPKEIHALSQLFPVLRRVEVARTARRRRSVAADPRMLRQQAARGLKEMLARIAMRQPLVLFIDDLQWGDVDSAGLLGELLSGPERPAMLLVCTYRSSDRERSPCLSTLLELLRGMSQLQVREVAVEELSEPESVELSRTLLGAESEQDPVALARESRGSPYLLGELVDHVRSERQSSEIATAGGSVTLERALSERLETLSAEATTVLELVSVSGRPLREDVIAQLAASDHSLATALLELRRAKLVRGVGATDARAIAIYHDSIRESVLARMHPSWVADLHKRLAAAIEKSEPVDLEALTEHLIGAGDRARAGIYAISAAHAAAEALAFDKAAALYQVALEQHPDEAWRQELYEQLAEAFVSAGRSTRAAEVYLRAVQSAPESQAADLQLKAGVQLLQSGRWQRGMEVLAPALDKLKIELPRVVGEAVLMAGKYFQKLRDRGFEFVPKAERELAPETRARLDALWSLVQATFSADPISCQVVVLHHLLEALYAGEKSRIVVGLCAHFIIVDLVYSAARGGKPRALQQAQALARDVQDPRAEAWVCFARGFSFQNEGLIKPASLDFARAEELFRNRCQGVMPELNACRMLYARTLVMLGQIDDHGQTERWTREAIACDDLVAIARLRLMAVPRRLMLGDRAQAERSLDVPNEILDNPLGVTRLLTYSARAWLAHYTDDLAALEAVAEESEKLSSSPLFVVPVWHADHLVLRARTLLALSRHVPEPETCLGRAQAAIDRLERIALDCYVDHARILRATLLHRRGRDTEALAALESILADADMGGESSLVRQCARMCKGQLLGGDEGATLIHDAERDLERRGVLDPRRTGRLYAAGFAELESPPTAT